jgi:hypothetical protein
VYANHPIASCSDELQIGPEIINQLRFAALEFCSSQIQWLEFPDPRKCGLMIQS